ncbi:MAG: methyl-accepting chemotaxis protein, partial [Bdellovibrionaceae bacterium]|nr:methyl-accepting chemotaxis protein [Pseudobdellovibrionaceae bacterium]
MVGTSEQIKVSAQKFSEDMHGSIQELEAAMGVIRQVAKKTEVINEIVFQTKLLSFNASVEAARAGEAGKGFAVVAEEVGKLAKMSGDAATEISQIVEKGLSAVPVSYTHLTLP